MGKLDFASRRMNLLSLKIKHILFALLFLLITKPQIVTRFDYLDFIWDISNVICFVVFAVFLFTTKNAKRSDVYLALFCLMYCGVTYYYSPGNFLGALSSSIRVWLAFSCVKYCLMNESYQTIKAIVIVFSIELYLEFVVFAFNYYFVFLGDVRFSIFGYDNYSIFAIAPMLAVLFAIDAIFRKKYSANSILLFILMLTEKMMTWAITSLVVLALMAIALYSIRYKTRLQSVFNHKTGFALLCGLSALVILLHAQDLLSPFFEIFGKDSTISGRTTIWEAAFRSIGESPLFGHGRVEGDSFLEITGLPLYEKSWGHTHNGILEILFTTGIVGICLYIAFLISVFRSQNSTFSNFQTASKILLVGVFSYALLLFTDSYLFVTPFYSLLGMYEALQQISDSKLGRKGQSDSAMNSIELS